MADSEPMEMYLCPSYVDDDGNLIDCKCGRCEVSKREDNSSKGNGNV